MLPINRHSAVQIAAGTATLGIALVLFVMSSRSGREQFESAQSMLDDIASMNVQIDSSLVPLLFELRTDFDTVTAQQAGLLARTTEYAGRRGDGQAATLVARTTEKLSLIEDLKSQQAVTRNSRAIASEMLTTLQTLSAQAPIGDQRGLFGVERAFLQFVSRRDPVSAATLQAAMDSENGARWSWTVRPEWQTFTAHANTLIRYTASLTGIIDQVYLIPIHAAIAQQYVLARSERNHTADVAGRFRVALLAVIVGLLIFSSVKVWEVGRFVAFVRRANEDLEHRVEERTGELRAANESLEAGILQREKVEAQLRLSQKLESIGHLAAGIAHEINTPVQYVGDNIRFVQDAFRDVNSLLSKLTEMSHGPMDARAVALALEGADLDFVRDEVPKALESSADGCQRIAGIVKAMKEFSHPAQGKTEVDLNRAIASTVTVATSEWRYVASLQTDLDPALPRVTCLPGEINQVILNLLVNAAHAVADVVGDGTNGMGTITVVTRLEDPWVRIRISDTGTGITPEIRDKIFDPFFTTKQVGRGTGQGLAIVHDVVVNKHGGTITIESEPGKGSTFIVSLPVVSAPVASALAA